MYMCFLSMHLFMQSIVVSLVKNDRAGRRGPCRSIISVASFTLHGLIAMISDNILIYIIFAKYTNEFSCQIPANHTCGIQTTLRRRPFRACTKLGHNTELATYIRTILRSLAYVAALKCVRT